MPFDLRPALERKQASLRDLGQAGEFEAVIATLGTPDSDGDVIEPSAFANTDTVAVLPAHDQSSVPLGKARIEVRGDQAVAVGRLNLATQAGRDWHSALRFDLSNPPAVQEWSFGFTVRDSERRDGNRILRDLDVVEVSLVLRGAGVGTGTIAAKARDARPPAWMRFLPGPDHATPEEAAKWTEDYFRAERMGMRYPEQHASDMLHGDRETLRAAERAAQWWERCRAAESEGKALYKTLLPPAWLTGVAEKAARDLEVPPPCLRLFRRCPTGTPHDVILGKTVLGTTYFGSLDRVYPRTYIREGLSRKEAIFTVLHEAVHQWEAKHGLEADEARCDQWAADNLDRYFEVAI